MNNQCGRAAPQEQAVSPSNDDEAKHKRTVNEYDMLLQPDSSPISLHQLAAEARGIYAGLVMVEAKCINTDAHQAANPKSYLGPEQWQDLIALHRTLLYEHYDFLIAAHHPAATSAFRELATKYSMPARMWKHGIHAFLEVLRHRRPDSQEYMLTFIYLAYRMMALLYETVPRLSDTWMECLGDLARYGMAIEEEEEARATWMSIASRWYTLASDRHPAIGRLYHHLGILERPSLRKYCYYTKALTCVIPFPKARDSLVTLCESIVQDKQTIESSRQSVEARIVTYHALVSMDRDPGVVDPIGQDCFYLLKQQPSKLRDFGANFAVANIAIQLGPSTNMLWQLYTNIISQHMQSSRPSQILPHDGTPAKIMSSTITPLLQSTTSFTVNCINFVLEHYNYPDRLEDSLSFIHVSLVWIHSLHSLKQRLGASITRPGHGDSQSLTIDGLFNIGRLVDSQKLARLLNILASQPDCSITARMLECARQGVFVHSRQIKEDHKTPRPLAEDFTVRGLIWSQFYFCEGWFDGQSEDDRRNIESDNTAQARAERVLWLGLFLAFHTELLQYDVHGKVFSGVQKPTQEETISKNHEPTVLEPLATSTKLVPFRVGSRASVSTSSSNSEDGGWSMVEGPRIAESISTPRHLE